MAGTKISEATLREILKGTENIPITDTDLPKGRTTVEKLKEYVHPFTAGDIQNPKSMDGENMEQLIIPGFYYGVPQNTGVGNPPAITDRAVLQISYMDNKSTRTVLQVLFPDGNSPYYRTNPGEVWTDWKTLSETDLTGTAVKPNTFASGDLDTLTQTGMYVLTSDILGDYTNFPPVPTGYTPYYPVLYVYNSGGVVSQTISVNHGDNKLYNYCRNNQSGTFGDWTGGAVGGVGKSGEAEYSEVFNSMYNIASGMYSHAEGSSTIASGMASHAEGIGTIAAGNGSHAEGANNVFFKGNTPGTYMQSVVGIGDDTGKKNARSIMQNGDYYIIGIGNYLGTENSEEEFEGKKSLQTVISELQAAVQTLQEQIAALQGTVA